MLLKTLSPEKIPSLVEEFNYSVPRYTSYPTAPQFSSLSFETYQENLVKTKGAFSIYIHIPFCERMCLFCACSVVLNRKRENAEIYLRALFKEMRLFYETKGKVDLVEVHLGGGTPTSLDEDQLERLFSHLHKYFSVTDKTEFAIEIDPRTVFQDKGKKLAFLKQLKVDRVSFGIQDLNPKVQEAIKRRQSYEMSLVTVEKAKELSFSSINVDLIYGLPFQSLSSFTKTVEEILLFSVDRIALFSYAHVPWLKKHQQALSEKTLPSPLEKFQLYTMAKDLFQKGGYTLIGMDHFAKKEDSLVKAFHEKKLMRNFQGYAVKKALHYIGFGVTSIGFLDQEDLSLYTQNEKTLSEYYALLEKGKSPVCKGFLLEEEDQIRRWVIQQIMCYQKIEKSAFVQKFRTPFEMFFSASYTEVKKAEEKGFLEESAEAIQVTEKGSFFLRNIASLFDAYYQKQDRLYSKGI